MTIFHAIILGLVQGLGEFLPISSSAHLVLVPWFFGWQDPGLGFDVALHWGTLLAVLVYFRQDVFRLIVGFWRSLLPSTRDLRHDLYQRLAWLLVLASVPGAVVGKLLEKKAEAAFRAPWLLGVTLAGFGLLLWAADRLGRKRRDLTSAGWGDALAIGCSQALAVIPGVSRSGSTMAAGQALGFQRVDTARFSFLMSMPIIFGAGLAQLKHFGDGVTAAQLAAGFLTAALAGFLAIRYLLRYLAQHSFLVFVWYRLALAAAVFAVYFLRGR